jgi:hypothetical protein
MDNEFWLDIWGGDSSYDIYEDNQAVMNELYPPDPERDDDREPDEPQEDLNAECRWW